jgi:hypothetical protein
MRLKSSRNMWNNPYFTLKYELFPNRYKRDNKNGISQPKVINILPFYLALNLQMKTSAFLVWIFAGSWW